jgi:hypothetical protein
VVEQVGEPSAELLMTNGRECRMQKPLNDQLRELIDLANDRGLSDAAELLQRWASRMIVFRPGESDSARFDPVEEIFFRGARHEKPEKEDG